MKHLTPSNNVPGAKQGTADSLAAPGRVGAGGTHALEEFQRWLETKAHNSASWVRSMAPLRVFAEDVFLEAELEGAECRVATKLLMQFKLEQGQ